MNSSFSGGILTGISIFVILLIILNHIVPESFPLTKILSVTIHSEDGEVIQTTQYCQCKKIGEK